MSAVVSGNFACMPTEIRNRKFNMAIGSKLRSRGARTGLRLTDRCLCLVSLYSFT